MKTLKLSSELKRRLDRLEVLGAPIGELHFRGEDINDWAGQPMVAIVGTRKPTPYGVAQTEKIAKDLAKNGVIIVSGLALGTDAIAHKAALGAGGKCLGVLPSGVDKPYPATNRPLAEKLLEQGGALISEYPSGHRPYKVDFLTRNRIVAGISDAVIITEAAAQSGTISTANRAHKMGIPVLAVPGNLTSPMSEGCNRLISEGEARLITGAGDVLSKLGIQPNSQTALDLVGASDIETLILQKIASGAGQADQLLTETRLEFSELQTALTMLEINGRISQNSLGEWRISQ